MEVHCNNPPLPTIPQQLSQKTAIDHRGFDALRLQHDLLVWSADVTAVLSERDIAVALDEQWNFRLLAQSASALLRSKLEAFRISLLTGISPAAARDRSAQI